MSHEGEQWQRLSVAFGLCMPVANLKSPSPKLALELYLGEYRPFYLAREEDAMARKHLQEKSGLLVIGRPLSGKTRMALEAMLAVVPDPACLDQRQEGEAFARRLLRRHRQVRRSAVRRADRPPLSTSLEALRGSHMPERSCAAGSRERLTASFSASPARSGWRS